MQERTEAWRVVEMERTAELRKRGSDRQFDGVQNRPVFDLRAGLGEKGEWVKGLDLVRGLITLSMNTGYDAKEAENESEVALWDRLVVRQASRLGTGDVVVHCPGAPTTLRALSLAHGLSYWQVESIARLSGARERLSLLGALDPGGAIKHVRDATVDSSQRLLVLESMHAANWKRCNQLQTSIGAGPERKAKESVYQDTITGKKYRIYGDVTQRTLANFKVTAAYRRLTEDTALGDDRDNVAGLSLSEVWEPLLRSAKCGYDAQCYKSANLVKYPYMVDFPSRVAEAYFNKLGEGLFQGIGDFMLTDKCRTGHMAAKMEVANSLLAFENFFVFVHGIIYIDLFRDLRERLTEKELARDSWDSRFLVKCIDDTMGNIYHVLKSFTSGEFAALYASHDLGEPASVKLWMQDMFQKMQVTDHHQSKFLRELPAPFSRSLTGKTRTQTNGQGKIIPANVRSSGGTAAGVCKYHLLHALGAAV